MAFRDLHEEIGAMFRAFDGSAALEEACFQAYQRKLARDRAWRADNLEAVRAYCRAWCRRNRARVTAYQRERRARERLEPAGTACCAVCERPWTVTKAERKWGKRFCSRRCAGKANRARGKLRTVTIAGRTRPLADWAAHYGLTPSAVYARMRAGMSEIEALTTPDRRRRAA